MSISIIFFVWVCFYVCDVCVCTRIYAWECSDICMNMWLEARSHDRLPLFIVLYLVLLRKDSLLNPELTDWLGWRRSKLQVRVYLIQLSCGYQGSESGCLCLCDTYSTNCAITPACGIFNLVSLEAGWSWVNNVTESKTKGNRNNCTTKGQRIPSQGKESLFRQHWYLFD